jgi:hypothetical protein
MLLVTRTPKAWEIGHCALPNGVCPDHVCMSEPTLRALQSLRLELVKLAGECDRALYATAWDARTARLRLPALLDAMELRIRQLRAALAQEERR